ncbi:E3 ubiquitin-protein ligase UBR5-like isoform X2 [Clytia hemisphaerica]
MASLLMFAHSVSCSQDDFNNNLKRALKNKNGSADWSSSIPLDANDIKEVVIGPNHLAFLTKDGRICRVSYHLDSENSNYSSPKHSSDEEFAHPSASKKTPAQNVGNMSSGSGTGNATGNSGSNVTPSSNSNPPSSSGELTSQSHTFSITGENLNSLSGSLGRWTSQRVSVSNASTGSNTTSVSNPLTMRATTRGRARILRAARGRAGTGGWLSNRAVIPASAVPEELISQAQVVLQGKSRQAIIRELQKTSLDVNLAVNNLLSRDDDEPEDAEEESYMQEYNFPGEDLMSIFEAGIPSDEPFVVQRDALFPEDIIYSSSNQTFNRDESRTTNRVTTNQSGSSSANREELSSCVRDRWWGMLLDRNEKSGSSSQKSKSKDISFSGKTTQRFGEIKWWTTETAEDENAVRFSHIGALHSELVAISTEGHLHQWLWSAPHPPTPKKDGHCHTRAEDMHLVDTEKVTKLAAWNIRASIVTESGKIATWLDETLAAVGHKLEHPLQMFSELKELPIQNVYTCDLYSAVQLTNGAIFWWGVFPFEQRKKILDKVKTKAKKSAIAGSSQIKPGTLVCIRSCPLYYPGAIGFTTINGEPKVGELLDKAWSITEKCRFKILDKKKTPNPTPPKSKQTSPAKEGSSTSSNEANQEKSEVKMETSETQEIQATPVIGQKRKHFQLVTPKTEDNNDDYVEEEWYLQNVIFVEDVRHVPIGEVLKVDGAYAIVHFSQKTFDQDGGESKRTMDVDLMLKESVIRRKDELQIVKWTTPPKMPECYQKVPKQLSISNSKVVSMTLDNNGIHALLKSHTGLRYSVYSLASGRPNPGGNIQHEPASFLMRATPNNVRLHPSDNKSVMLLRDSNNCLYPLVKDNVGGIQNPTWTNLSSVSCMVTARKRSSNHSLIRPSGKSKQLALTVLIVEDNNVLQAILSADCESLRKSLEKAQESEEFLNKLVGSKCDGNRNICHLAVNMCHPEGSKQRGVSSAGGAAEDSSKDDSSDDIGQIWSAYDSLECLETILDSPVLKKHLLSLLSERDAFGYTPFMAAVRIRAYPAALKIYDAASLITTHPDTGDQNTEELMSMIYPNGCDLDMSPLHMLCRNDTCSFTWTGTKHINQDIFECKTCGLVGPLCCCTECAQVCHIGHECKLKRTSPTAYCDCWEKCPCKALVAGDQEKRKLLLYKLVGETDLCTRPNKSGHHILLFLAQTVARQASEQEQYVPNRMSASGTGSLSSKQRLTASSRAKSGQTPPTEHEQEPPKFSRFSLTFILKNWEALMSMIMFGCTNTGSRRAKALDDNIVIASLLQTHEIGQHLDTQNGTAYLDNFVHKLIVKCNSEFLEVLLQTILYRLQEDLTASETEEVLTVARRFVRAVIRVYVVLVACLANNSAKRKSMSVTLTKCKHVFQSLNMIAAQEMSDVACSLFAPVRMGVVYPSPPFVLGTAPDATSTSDDIFSTPPLPQRYLSPTSGSSSSNQRNVRFAEQVTSGGGSGGNAGNEDEEMMETDQSRPSQEASNSLEGSQGVSSGNEMDIDLEAESDTDSEDSNNGDGHESSMQSEGSRRDGYYSTTEVSETEGEDDEEDEDVDDDEDDDDDDDDDENDVINQNEQASNDQRNSGVSESSMPNALQWAVRNSISSSTSTNVTSAAHISGSSLVLFDNSHLRRAAASAGSDGSLANSMYCTPSALARTYFMLIREVSDLLNTSDAYNCLPLGRVSIHEARKTVDDNLHSTWEWLWRVMEETEAKLRFGASLTSVSDLGHAQNTSNDTSSKSKSSRVLGSTGAGSSAINNPLRSLQEGRRKKRSVASLTASIDSPNARHEYLSYILSLMRSHHDEHADALPKLEITSLRHVAYILDSFIYFVRSKQQQGGDLLSGKKDDVTKKLKNSKGNNDTDKPTLMKVDKDNSQSDKDSQDDEDDDDDQDPDDGNMTDFSQNENSNLSTGSRPSYDITTLRATSCNRFFKRSDSTLTLGCEPCDPFATPLKEALPLADRPHLLNPAARRDHLFGVKKQNDQLLMSAPTSQGSSQTNTKSNSQKQPMTMKLHSNLQPADSTHHLAQSPNSYLSRWHMSLELFGRVFMDDVGGEPHSVLNELGRYDVKEAKFKRDMEKLRTTHQKDLYLDGLERSRDQLIPQALRQLNSQFGRRLSGTTPFSVHKVKVSFKDEQGEGSGLARSFYTAISNAFLADEKLPSLDHLTASGREGLSQQLRSRAKERERERRRSSGTNLPSGMVPRVVRRNERSSERTANEIENCPLSLDAAIFFYNSDAEDNEDDYSEPIPMHKRELGRRIYKKVVTINPENVGKITGMLLEMTPTQIIYLLSRDSAFKDKVNEAAELITGQPSSQTSTSSNKNSTTPISTPLSSSNTAGGEASSSKTTLESDDDFLDNSPLFYQPGKPGYYSPRPGRNGLERLDCFRNVGRVIGLCLEQNEICPLSLNRHVLKYILSRPISWHDLAFYDPTLYESLRQLIEDSKRPDSSEFFSSLDLTFYIQLPVEEGGHGVELTKGGAQVEVAPDNVLEYVKKYAEYRMYINCSRCLQAIKRGVQDVISLSHLEGLTAEDLRLLLNGAGDINIQQLQAYTTFSDETGGEGQDKLTKFKKWFWSILENMTSKQKQDLLYFWTSSPAMPASAEGFQPMPSVTVKPANDHQLPTANT